MSRDGLVTGELAPVLSSYLDDGDTSSDMVSAREQAAVHEVLVVTLCEQALMAMTHSQWSQAEALAGEARTVFRRAGVQTSYAIPLICAVQARAALHRGDVPAARQELIGAQRLRHLLTSAMPRIATQTRIELVRVYLANLVEYDPINSFHVHGNFFHHYPTGTSLEPAELTDIVVQGQAQRCILELRFPTPGRYMFHAHKTEFAELGWTGFFEVS